MTRPALPIDPEIPGIVAALREHGAATISSPPGSGKTTRVPPALVDAFEGGVIVLEPRRIAARAAARRVASELGVKLGEEVGYEVRDDRRVSRVTRLRFQTEGVLVRRLLVDPFLEGVGTVVLDEFHERHLDTDLALAMLREVRDTVRPELRIVVMSATLDVAPIVGFLQPCAELSSGGRSHEVRVENADRVEESPLERRVRLAVSRALDDTDGDVLVFLPGMAEIRRAERELADLARRRDADLRPLHGSLDAAAQDAAIRPGARRKVVLSTNVAESSLTIEGVTAVVDSGLARVLRHDVARGLDALRVERISLASATQRAGRAGRTGPGVCYRLWTRGEERSFAEHDTAEIRRVDLAPPSLAIRVFAGRDPRDFGWFEPPDEAALSRADDLLRMLDLIDAEGKPTADGAAAVRLPAHPRLARMLLEGKRRDCARAAAEVAAVLSEREPRGLESIDLHDVLAGLQAAERARFDRGACRAAGYEPGAARSIARMRDRMQRVVRADPGVDDPDAIACAVLAGFPDRVVACRHGEGRGQLVGGRGVEFRDPAFTDVELLVALSVGDHGSSGRSLVRLALPIEREWLDEVHPGSVVEERRAEFDRDGRVAAMSRTRYFDLVLDERRGGRPDPAAVERLLADAVRAEPFAHLGEQTKLRGYVSRMAWLRKADPEGGLPEWTEREIGEAAAQLAPGKRSLREFRDAPVLELLEAGLSRAQREAIRREAPPTLRLPSGRELRIDYEPEPHVADRLQEFFGMGETPRIAGGRVPITVHLLAPNRRPVQITNDLASFWDNVYPSVRTELRNRYPKHSWPEDPRGARPDAPGRRRRRRS